MLLSNAVSLEVVGANVKKKINDKNIPKPWRIKSLVLQTNVGTRPYFLLLFSKVKCAAKNIIYNYQMDTRISFAVCEKKTCSLQ